MISNASLGALSELVACAWLLREGYQVFRNVSPHGPYDVVAIKGDDVIRIDVKTIRRYGSEGKYPIPNHKLRAPDAVILYVDAEDQRCVFRISDLGVTSRPEDSACNPGRAVI